MCTAETMMMDLRRGPTDLQHPICGMKTYEFSNHFEGPRHSARIHAESQDTGQAPGPTAHCRLDCQCLVPIEHLVTGRSPWLMRLCTRACPGV